MTVIDIYGQLRSQNPETLQRKKITKFSLKNRSQASADLLLLCQLICFLCCCFFAAFKIIFSQSKDQYKNIASFFSSQCGLPSEHTLSK